MKYEVVEMYRNEAILEVLKERDELWEGANIVSLVEEIEKGMPKGAYEVSTL